MSDVNCALDGRGGRGRRLDMSDVNCPLARRGGEEDVLI